MARWSEIEDKVWLPQRILAIILQVRQPTLSKIVSGQRHPKDYSKWNIFYKILEFIKNPGQAEDRDQDRDAKRDRNRKLTKDFSAEMRKLELELDGLQLQLQKMMKAYACYEDTRILLDRMYTELEPTEKNTRHRMIMVHRFFVVERKTSVDTIAQEKLVFRITEIERRITWMKDILERCKVENN